MYINIRKKHNCQSLHAECQPRHEFEVIYYILIYYTYHSPLGKQGKAYVTFCRDTKKRLILLSWLIIKNVPHTLLAYISPGSRSFDRTWSWNQRSYQLCRRQSMLLKPVLFLILSPNSQNQRAHWLQFSHFIEDTETQREVASLRSHSGLTGWTVSKT